MQGTQGIFEFGISVIFTILGGVLTQLWRQRKQLRVAVSDPLNFALKTVVDTFAFQDESLYLMNLLSKLIKSLVKYMTLLASNGGDDLVANELIKLTKLLDDSIATLQNQVSETELSENQVRILDEVKSMLLKQQLKKNGG